MDLTGQGINNTYIVRSLIEETEFIQRWETGAVFSPNTFYLDLVKSESLSRKILDRSDEISEKLMNLQNIRNHSLLRTIEFGEFNNCFFTIQQKITGTSLYRIFDDGKNLSRRIILKIMNDLSSCLVSFEKRGISHNLLSSRSVWFPENFDILGSVFISDTLLFCLMSLSNVNLESHFKNPDPCISSGSISGNEYHSDIKNDLYSFGFIFYYLITGGAIFQNKEEIDYSFISDDSVVKFLTQLLGREMQIQTASELRESFLSVFEKELYTKQTEIERNYSLSEAQMYSTNLKNINYEGLTIPQNEQDDDKAELVELFEDDIAESTELYDEETVGRKTPVKIAKDIVKTVFGFFSRFRKNGRKDGNNININSAGNGMNPSNSKITNNPTVSPTGDLQHKNDNQSGTKLRRLFKDLTSHYTNNEKKRINNKRVKILDFNRRDSTLTNQVDNHEEISKLSENREYTKITEKSDFIIGDYVPSEKTRTDFIFGDLQNRVNDAGNISKPPVNNTKVDLKNNIQLTQEVVPDFEGHIFIEDKQNPEVLIEVENESEAEKIITPSSENENLHDPIEASSKEKYSLWNRFLKFIKKFFKFYK